MFARKAVIAKRQVKTGVGKMEPVSQIWPTKGFCLAHRKSLSPTSAQVQGAA